MCTPNHWGVSVYNVRAAQVAMNTDCYQGSTLRAALQPWAGKNLSVPVYIAGKISSDM